MAINADTDTVTLDSFDATACLGLIDNVITTAPLTQAHRDDLASVAELLRTALGS